MDNPNSKCSVTVMKLDQLKIDDLNARVEALKHDLEHMKRVNEQLSLAIHTKVEFEISQRNELKALDEEIHRLVSVLSDKENQILSTSNLLKNAKQEISNLQKQLSRSRKDAEELTQQIHNLENKIINQNSQIQKDLVEKENMTFSVRKLQGENRELLAAKNRLSSQIAVVEDDSSKRVKIYDSKLRDMELMQRLQKRQIDVLYEQLRLIDPNQVLWVNARLQKDLKAVNLSGDRPASLLLCPLPSFADQLRDRLRPDSLLLDYRQGGFALQTVCLAAVALLFLLVSAVRHLLRNRKTPAGAGASGEVILANAAVRDEGGTISADSPVRERRRAVTTVPVSDRSSAALSGKDGAGASTVARSPLSAAEATRRVPRTVLTIDKTSHVAAVASVLSSSTAQSEILREQLTVVQSVPSPVRRIVNAATSSLESAATPVINRATAGVSYVARMEEEATPALGLTRTRAPTMALDEETPRQNAVIHQTQYDLSNGKKRVEGEGVGDKAADLDSLRRSLEQGFCLQSHGDDTGSRSETPRRVKPVTSQGASGQVTPVLLRLGSSSSLISGTREPDATTSSVTPRTVGVLRSASTSPRAAVGGPGSRSVTPRQHSSQLQRVSPDRLSAVGPEPTSRSVTPRTTKVTLSAGSDDSGSHPPGRIVPSVGFSLDDGDAGTETSSRSVTPRVQLPSSRSHTPGPVHVYSRSGVSSLHSSAAGSSSGSKLALSSLFCSNDEPSSRSVTPRLRSMSAQGRAASSRSATPRLGSRASDAELPSSRSATPEVVTQISPRAQQTSAGAATDGLPDHAGNCSNSTTSVSAATVPRGKTPSAHVRSMMTGVRRQQPNVADPGIMVGTTTNGSTSLSLSASVSAAAVTPLSEADGASFGQVRRAHVAISCSRSNSDNNGSLGSGRSTGKS